MTKTTSAPNAGTDEAARKAVRGFARAMRILERASKELSMAHYRVLASVAAGEERASRVAERLELGRPAISSAVEALCAGGYIDRLDVEGDQRAVHLRVTRRGSELLERVEGEMTSALSQLCARLANGEAVLASLGSLEIAVDALYEEKRDARVRGER